MTLTLRGRMQTRAVLTGCVGLPAALLAALLAALPMRDGSGAEPTPIVATLALMTVLGMGWECLYHGLQQRRADRDWPSLAALLAVLVEIGPLALAAAALPDGARPGSGAAFVVPVLGAWSAAWLVAQGPLRVVVPRWRFSGGRLW